MNLPTSPDYTSAYGVRSSHDKPIFERVTLFMTTQELMEYINEVRAKKNVEVKPIIDIKL